MLFALLPLVFTRKRRFATRIVLKHIVTHHDIHIVPSYSSKIVVVVVVVVVVVAVIVIVVDVAGCCRRTLRLPRTPSQTHSMRPPWE